MSYNITNSIKKANKRISILYPLLHKKSYVNFHSKITLYRSYIRPILTYACPVFSNSAKTHIAKLQVTQNKCLRMVLNAPYITKITELHEKSNIPYMTEYIDKLTNSFYDKANISKNSLIKRLGKYSANTLPFRVKHKLPKKTQ